MKTNSEILEQKLEESPSGVYLDTAETITLILELQRLEKLDKES